MSRTILVTGASSGMGREAVLAYVQRGWNVVVTMRDPDRADTRFADLEQVMVARLDVTDTNSIQAALAEGVARFGGVDAVLNNAGYAQTGAVEEVSREQLRAQFETNVVGLVEVVRAVLPHLRERGAGHILNIGSMGGHVSLPTMALYCASKSAVQNLTEGLAKELAPLGIDVTLVEPAGYSTDFTANSVAPAASISDYAPAYDAMRAFAQQATRGDLDASVAAIADITGIEQPPRRLAVNTFGLVMARSHVAELLADYDRWEPITATTG